MRRMTTLSLDPIAELWQGARAWFAGLRAAFGAPAQVAALAREACAALRRELLALESLVLKLLLLEAARLGLLRDRRAALAPHADSAQAVAFAARRLRKLSAQELPPADAQAPEQAPDDAAGHAEAAFALRLPYDRLPLRTRRSAAGVAREPRPDDLARRFEALAQVLIDPAPAIARLARRLRALGPRARAVARRIAMHYPRAEPRDPMLFAHACVACCDVLEESG